MFVLFPPTGYPELYLVPATAWERLNDLLVSREATGKCEAYWAFNISKKNQPLADTYRFASTVERLI